MVLIIQIVVLIFLFIIILIYETIKPQGVNRMIIGISQYTMDGILISNFSYNINSTMNGQNINIINNEIFLSGRYVDDFLPLVSMFLIKLGFDLDLDGLTNSFENIYLTDFNDNDTDDDLLSDGDEVKGVINWDRRYKLMRYHTGTHVLCGIFNRDYNLLVTGNQLTTEKGRVDLNMETIMERVGYNDPSSFSLLFKRLTHLTPREYRQQFSIL